MTELDDLRKRVAQLEQAALAHTLFRKPAEDHMHQILVVSRIEGAGVHERFGDMYQSWFVTERLVSDAHIDLTGEAIKRMTCKFLREFEDRQVKLGMVPEVPPGDLRMAVCDARLEVMRMEGKLNICKTALQKITLVQAVAPKEDVVAVCKMANIAQNALDDVGG